MPKLFSLFTKPQPVTPPPNSSSDWAIHQSQVLINSAGQKAQNIVAQAELEGIKIATQSGIISQEFVGQSNRQLESSIKQAEEAFNSNLTVLNQKYSNFLDQLQAHSLATQKVTEESIQTRINEILFNIEQKLVEFLSQSEQKSTEAIGLELKSAQEMIETYRNQQFALIDDNIVAVLERTLSLVLQKKLSLADQMDLVYDALEKAKAEKFFG